MQVEFSIVSLTSSGTEKFIVVQDNLKLITGVFVDGKYHVAIAKGKKGSKKIDELVNEFRKSDKSPVNIMRTATEIFKNPNEFEYTSVNKEAYREFLRIWLHAPIVGGGETPLFPNESFELMKEWYENLKTTKENEMLKDSIDEVSTEMRIELEKKIIRELIIDLDRDFFSKLTSENNDKIQKPHQHFKPRFKEVPLRQFEKWLTFRLKELENDNSVIDSQPIDLSDSKAIEKLIYLKELGVLEFLRTQGPFLASINSLASFLSAVTGENTTTLQPYLNAHYSANVEKDKDFYRDSRTKQRVKRIISENGFKLE